MSTSKISYENYADARGKVIITNSVTGALTDPQMFNFLPVTPVEMGNSAAGAYDEGACMIHCHFRQQGEGMGRCVVRPPARPHNDATKGIRPGTRLWRRPVATTFAQSALEFSST